MTAVFRRNSWHHIREPARPKAKRALDAVASGAGLVLLSPVMAVIGALIWLEDRGHPLYRAKRCGIHQSSFTMLKFRTMVQNADQIGGSSTGSKDPRITKTGALLRATKLDELPQLTNVFKGEMSLVGPRPNVEWEVASFSAQEQELLTVRPGITDLASIIFADEGEILADASDPDLSYEQLIRPWKSQLGMLYAANANVVLDLRIILLTLINSVSRTAALKHVSALVSELGGGSELVRIALRDTELQPTAPPGHTQIIERVPCE